MNSSSIQLSIHSDASKGKPHCKLDLHKLLELFQAASFWASDRRIEDLEIAIAHSNPVVSAWQGDQLVGFARATSDGVYRATIWDVVVHPAHQSKGIGRKLVQTVLSQPHVNRVERVYLMTTFKEKFYERVGFQRNSTTTMVLYQQAMDTLPVNPDLTEAGPEAGIETETAAICSSIHMPSHQSPT